MAFLKILLLILKILGFTLLGIIGVILLALLIVLFVPVRYGGEGGYSDEPDTKTGFFAKVTWLLHIISVSYRYGEEEPLCIRIFGIRLGKKKERPERPSKKKKKKDKEKADPEKPEDKAEDTAFVKPEDKPEDNVSTGETSLSGPEIVIIEDEPVPVGSAPGIPSDPETTEGSFEDDDKTAEEEKPADEEPGDSKSTTHKDGKYDKIKKYADILRSEEFKDAFSLCGENLVKLLKQILPRKWEVSATLGFEDPATLGTVLGIHGILYSIVHRHVYITPAWDRSVIDVSGHFKGHITAAGILIIGLRVYFNKNIKKIIKMFKEAR